MQVDDGRHAAPDARPVVQVQLHADAPGDGFEVDHRIGRTADGRVHADRVFEGFLGEDLRQLQVFAHHLHRTHAGHMRQHITPCIHRRDRRVVGQGGAECLGHAGHGRRGAHGVAGARRTRHAALGREEVIQAATLANAHDFIVGLPDGYDTVLGEKGANLSGGQRQRISIARALLKDAPLLILDEPTSALDAETEALIMEGLERLMQNRTTFVIAHRLSMMRRADMILVIKNQRIHEMGSYDELMAQNGEFARLHAIQMGKGKPEKQPSSPLVA